MKSSLPISDELLSAYIDRQISDAERRRVETALAIDPLLQQRLESLHAIVNLLQNTPAVVAPRALTLTEEQVLAAGALVGRLPQQGFWDRWLPRLMPVATAVVGLLFAVSLAVPLGEAPAPVPMLEPVEEPAAILSQETQKFEEEAAPTIVLTRAVEASPQAPVRSLNVPATAVEPLPPASPKEPPSLAEAESVLDEPSAHEASDALDDEESKGAAPLVEKPSSHETSDTSEDRFNLQALSPVSWILGFLFVALLFMTGWISYAARRRI